MPGPITVISSMATRQILNELIVADTQTGRSVKLVSVGGVDAARRLRAGEVFDLVVLASGALEALSDDGYVIGDSIRTFARSPTAVALPAGVPRPARCDETAIRDLVSNAKRIGISTGPSGVSIERLLRDWGVPDLERRIVRAAPGVPVARMRASGEADIGFQQLSELLGEPGIEIVGAMPISLQPTTIFSCGIGRGIADAAATRDFIRFLVSDDAAAAKRRNGMEPGG